ncbi:hypothetical protein NMG60_11005152 [Bertholletia excelsa]
MASPLRKAAAGGEGGGSPESGSDGRESEKRTMFVYSGWVYHLGVNSIGHEYCRLRFLSIRGKYVELYKRDPQENPGIKPIRRGIVSHTLMVEELGRRRVNDGDVYVLGFYNRLDETKKGQIACATAGETHKWMEAFDHAKQQTEYELSRGGSARNKLNMETEINLEPEGRRLRVRRYAHGLKNLIRIGQGPESLLRKSSNLATHDGSRGYFGGDDRDVIEAHEWKCIHTVNGVRIFEDVADSKSDKGILVKAVGVIDASADSVFEVVMNVDHHQRYEWDMITGDLELVDSLGGHYDVLYATYNPRHLTRWHSKRDFVFTRQWFHGQDGTYTILQFPTTYKKCPPKSGYQRTNINPSSWEIKNLNSSHANGARCLVTQMLEIQPVGWFKWKSFRWSKFEKTSPCAFLSQVAGLKEYIGANPAVASEFLTSIHSKSSDSISEYDETEVADEFYDALSADSSDNEDSDKEEETNSKLFCQEKRIKLKNISWAIQSLALKRTSALNLTSQLDPDIPPVVIDPSHYHGSMRQGKDDTDADCWTSPNGSGFMIRGKTYLKDNAKIMGGDPLLKLIAVDWFKVEKCTSKVTLSPSSLVQSEAGKKLPFILVINLEVPAKPNYSLVLYYAADQPINKNSLLGKFVDGSDMFRDSRLKLIPRIVEGYWMVKRAVGTKACLLGKAVSCKYLREGNFLEIDVDIGSSSVARSVISLVLGYVTSIVVDLAILIEAKEEAELPEYILGTVRLNRVKLDSAVPYEG